jgi:dephospho-CoA kinase
MKIFVIVGMPAAGKNIARAYAESKGLIYYLNFARIYKKIK